MTFVVTKFYVIIKNSLANTQFYVAYQARIIVTIYLNTSNIDTI